MADLWDGVKQGLSTVAPILANAIIPGSGGLVGSLVSEVLGCENDPLSIEAALVTATPEQKTELVRIQADHKENLIELGIKADQIYLADVQSARDRQVESEKTTGRKDVNLYAMAWTVIAGFVTLIIVLMYADIPEENVGSVNLLLGAASAGFGAVINYFYGSSKTSAEKNHLLAKK